MSKSTRPLYRKHMETIMIKLPDEQALPIKEKLIKLDSTKTEVGYVLEKIRKIFKIETSVNDFETDIIITFN